MLIDYILQGGSHLGEELRRRLLLNLLPRPLLMLQVQLDLALVHCPSEPIQKGKQTNKTSNTCASDKGKQTNKQAEAVHCKWANWELGLWNVLHYSVSRGVIQRKERGLVK